MKPKLAQSLRLRRLLWTLAASLPALLLQSPVHAVVITTGCATAGSCTLAELEAGASIQVNDKLFNGFSETVSGSGFATLGNAANIRVTGLDADAANPGIRFTANGEWTSPTPLPGGSLIFVHNIQFDVAVVGGGASIIGSSLAVSLDPRGPSSNAGVEENLLGAGETDLGTLLGDYTDSTDSVSFSGQSIVHVEKNVSIFIESFSGSAGIQTIDQIFSQPAANQVPEPSSLLLSGLGLVIFGVWYHKGKLRTRRKSRR